MQLLNLKPGKEIGQILLQIRNKILNNEIANKKSDIKKYLLDGGFYEQR